MRLHESDAMELPVSIDYSALTFLSNVTVRHSYFDPTGPSLLHMLYDPVKGF
jgi:hypothetical protein